MPTAEPHPAPPTPASGDSILDGGSFETLAGSPSTLGEALVHVAHHHAERGIFFLGDSATVDRQSYGDLLRDAGQVLAGLREQSLKPGDFVLFQLDSNREFLTAFWACQLGGFVPVPVSIAPTYEQPHSILTKLKNASQLLGHPFILASDPLAPRLIDFSRREGLAESRVLALGSLKRSTPDPRHHRPQPSDIALLLLTSGSTGVPKAVRQTHEHLVAWALSAGRACDFRPSDISLNWMPLDHVGGLVMFHLRDLVTGCDQGHAPTEKVLQQPLIWLDWIERYRATITWAPNFAYSLVNDQIEQHPDRRWNLSSMRFILNGGEAIVSRTARRFLQLLLPHQLPATAMRPAWGMSETCSGVTYSKRFLLETTRDDDAFVDVGEPIPGVCIRLVDQNDQPVLEGKMGRLQIRGISITDGYHGNPEANQKSFTPDGWFITGDLGRISDGQLAITGREKDVIIINGVNFYSHEIEAVVEDVKGVEVSFVAACAVRTPDSDTDRLAVFFSTAETEASGIAALASRIRTEVAKREGVTPDFLVRIDREAFPKTAIGKIQRSLLREKFEAGAFRNHLCTADASSSEVFNLGWVEALPPSPRAFPAGSRVLLIAGEGAFRTALETVLTQQNAVVSVIDPTARSSFQDTLRQALAREESSVLGVVYAVPYDLTTEQDATLPDRERRIFAVLQDLQAIAHVARQEAPTRLLVVTRRAHAPVGGESLDPVHSAIVALERTLHQETDNLTTTSVDVSGRDPEGDVAAIVRELTTEPAKTEVAWRGGKRYLAALLPPTAPLTPPLEFQAEGLYVIIGGLGGVGRHVANYLTERYQARLLLVGRKSLDAPTVTSPQVDPADDRLRFLAELGKKGGRVRYAAGDAADPDFLRGEIERALQAFGAPLAGILHLAGEYHERLLDQETSATWSASFAGKAGAVHAIRSVADHHPNCLRLYFSSVLSQFPAQGTGAYAAANRVLDAEAALAPQNGGRSLSILWSLWQETGMGRGFVHTDAMQARGLRALQPAEALRHLETALRAGAPRVVVGVNANAPAISARIDTSRVVDSRSSHRDPVPARTDVERRLLPIWQEMLGRPELGVQDNFFEVGGRSLIAARIFARIEKEFGHKLPLATLYQAPTVETLALRLSAPAEGATERLGKITPIQAKGHLPPLYCIPGGGSDVIVFDDLSKALGPDQPLFGLQARGLDATPIEGACPTVEEVAKEFVSLIRRQQPSGPYYVSGHCFGALIAWEVARELTTQGHRVGLLALLDPIVSNVFSGEIMGRDRLRYHAGKFLRLSFGAKIAYLAEKVKNFSRTLVVRQRIAHSYDQARTMHERYRLESFAGPVAVFLARDSFFNVSPKTDPRRYYERLTPNPPSYFSAEGDHHGILHPPGVDELARHLRTALTQTRATPPRKS